jgi:hypothetical protein
LTVLGGYVITNGTFYAEDKDCKTLTKAMERAFVFTQEESANNVLQCLKNRKTNPLTDYYVDVQKKYVTPIDDQTQLYIDKFKTMLDNYKELSKTFDEIYDKLQNVDKEISDIEHYIELTDQNVVNGYKLYKRLKDLRVKRRNIKRLIDLSKLFKKITIDDSIKSDFESTVNGFSTRKYLQKSEQSIEDILSKNNK